MEKTVSDSINRKLVDITRKFYNYPEGKSKGNQRDLNIPDLFNINSATTTGIYNHVSCSYDFFSSNIKSLLGFDHKKFLQGNIQFILSLLHPTQRDLFDNEILPLLFKYYHLYSQKRKVTDLKCSFTLKMRRSDGNYIWTLLELRPFKTNSKGQPIHSILSISDISLFKKDEVNEFLVCKKSDAGLLKKIFSTSFSSTGAKYKFSKRELEIISLLAEGKTSKKIGEILNLSVHTVSTHRKNMIEKSSVQNTTELIKLATIRGLIENFNS
ncbi:LuxR C-terminal-related transcriptional regulator [Sporocytophaga myxococcoides]|uniref:LuxR C-terminal-related transcriptional regulator n=1 Tax=Sporocytophaga myxococcoides TaxID=153721 RepID=UPI0004237917|nr:LuxR C-terminal-related transcriptional regulator [Sporocytophaga myxococcoides]